MGNHLGHLFGAAFLLQLSNSPALASEEQQSLDAHEHGRGTINLVTVDSSLAIELFLPAINVVGFEHEPTTQAQKERIIAARKKLTEGAVLFTTSANADCQLHDVRVAIHGMQHDEHGHEDDHDEHDERGHEDEDEEGHSEFAAEYEFDCKTLPSEVTVNLFDHLLELDELDAQVVTGQRQSAKTLTPKDRTLELE